MSHVAQNYVYVLGEKKKGKKMPTMTNEQLKAAKDAVAKYRVKK